jgi:multiple sugar transport system permease protein
LDNYDRLVSSDLISVFWHTFVIAAGSVLLEVVVALPLALLLTTPMRGRGFMRALVTLPWVVPTVAVSTAFLWLLSTNYGLLNHILVAVGLVDTAVPFLSTSAGALAAVTCVFAWKGLPLVFVILLSALQSLPPEYREAARVDGAGRNAQIRYVVLPHLRTAVVLACVVSGVYNFAQFDLTYLLTGGGPHGATNTLPLLLYNAFQGLRDGQAAATGIVIFLAGLITLVLWSLWNRRWAYRRAELARLPTP